jgi:predicted ATPase
MTTNAKGFNENLLTFLRMKNFRAFESLGLEFAPITIFVGPNNAGKSSILSALRVLSQTVQSVDWNVPLLLGDFGTFRDVVFGNNANKTLGLRLGMRIGARQHSFEVNFKYRAQRREIIQQNFTAYDNDDPVVRTTYSRARERQTIRTAGLGTEQTRPLKVSFFHFLPRLVNLDYDLAGNRAKRRISLPNAARLRDTDEFIAEATRKLQALQYLGPNREAPLRSYLFSGERPSTVSPGGKGAMDMLMADVFTRGTRKGALSRSVQFWLAKAEIASSLQIHALSDRQFDVRLKHPITGELENLADVGYGVSQVLPVLIAGYNLGSGATFMVEQPELHLHPKAQSELGDFFCSLYKKGVQSVVETHSEHLILRLQRHIAAGTMLLVIES